MRTPWGARAVAAPCLTGTAGDHRDGDRARKYPAGEDSIDGFAMVGVVVLELEARGGPTAFGGRDLDPQPVPRPYASSGCHHLHVGPDDLVREQVRGVLASVR